MKEKISGILLKCKYELGIFIMLIIHSLIHFRYYNGMPRYFLPQYLVDFSMGINSRLWVGSIVSLLTDHPTENWINWFSRIILLLGLLMTAVVLGRVVRLTKKEERLVLFGFILFFCSGSLTVACFSKYSGLLDIHMYILTIVAVFIVRHKYFRWLVPLLCVAGVFVNYAYTISYFPLVVLTILYLADRDEKKAGNIALFSVTVITVLVVTFYCVFLGKNYMNVTFDELWTIVEQKCGREFEYMDIRYFSLYLFGIDPIRVVDKDVSTAQPLEFIQILSQTLYESTSDHSNITTLVVITVPVVLAFWFIWINCIRSTQSKSRKFVYLCFMLSTLFIPICCLLSTDFIRWIASGIIVQFALCFNMFTLRDEPFEKAAEKLKSFFTENKIVFWVIYIIYSLIWETPLVALAQ